MKVLRLTIGLVCFFFLFSTCLAERIPPDDPIISIRGHVSGIMDRVAGAHYAFNQALQALKQEYLDEKQALLEEKQQDIEAVKAGFAEQKEELQVTLDELGQEEQEAIAAIEEGYAGEIQELKDQIDTLKEAKLEAIKALRKEFISELLTAIKEGKFGDIIGIVKDYIADRKEVKQTFDEQIQEVQEQLAGVEEEKQLAIDEVRDAFTGERQEIQDQIAALEQGEQEAIAAIEEEYEGNLAELKDEYKDKITELWHEYFGEDSQPPERIFKKFFKEPKAPKGKDRGERGYRDEDDGNLGKMQVGDRIPPGIIDNPPWTPGPFELPPYWGYGDWDPGWLSWLADLSYHEDEPDDIYNPDEEYTGPLTVRPYDPWSSPITHQGFRNGDKGNIPFVPSMAGRSGKYLDLRR